MRRQLQMIALACALSLACADASFAEVDHEPWTIAEAGLAMGANVFAGERISGTIDEGGRIIVSVHNGCRVGATGLSVRLLEPTGAKVRRMRFESAAGWPEFVADPDEEASSTERVAAPLNGTPVDGGSEGVLWIVIEDGEGGLLPDDATVAFVAWWTRGISRNIPIAGLRAYYTDGDDSAAPSVSPEELIISREARPTLSCRGLTLSEGQGDLQEGSVVITRRSGVRFAMGPGTAVTLVKWPDDEREDCVVISNARVDDAGNFAFDLAFIPTVERASIRLEIRGLLMEFDENVWWRPGAVITAGLGGAAVGGLAVDEVWTLLAVTE